MKVFLTITLSLVSFLIFGQDTEPNNDPTQAIAIMLDQEIDGTISLADVDDYYKIELEQGGLLQIDARQTLPGGNYFNVYIIDAEDDTDPYIQTVNLSWATAQIYLNQRLLKGSYLIRIGAAYGNINYKFTASLFPPDWVEDVEDNSDAMKATPIVLGENITGNLQYYKAGKGLDQQDWYALDITEAGLLELDIRQLLPGGNYFSVHLIDAEMEDYPIINSKGFSWGQAQGALGQYIHPGLYFIRVSDAAGTVHYQFSSSLTPTLWESDMEPNGDTTIAQILPLNDTLTGHLRYYSAGDGLDETDWYEVEIPYEGELYLDIYKQNNSATFWLGLKDPNKPEFPVLKSKYFEFGHTQWQIKDRLLPGKYFIHVTDPNKGMSYKLVNRYYPDPIANFEYMQVSNSVVFKNQSMFGSSYSWDFGDDKESTAVNPFHKYDTPGVYDACLEVKNEIGVKRESCQVITIEGLAGINPNAGGNTGFVTATITGGGFGENCKVRIEKNGIPLIEEDTVILISRDALSVRLDLWGMPIGLYDVVVETSDGGIYTLPEGFSIEKGEKPDPWVSVGGRDKILFNTPRTFNILFGNRGNVDAYLVPLWIAISNVEGLEVSFSNAAFLDTLLNEEFPEDLPEYFETDTLFGEQKNMRIYSFILPDIPASSSNELAIRITSPEDIEIMTWVNDPYMQFRENENFSFNESGERNGQSDYNINVAICVAHLFSQVVEKQNIELSDDDKTCIFESYAAHSLALFSKKEDYKIASALLYGGTGKSIPIKQHVKFNYAILKYCLGLGFVTENKQFSYGLLLRVIRDQRKLTSEEVSSCLHSFCPDNDGFREDEVCEKCGTFCQKDICKKKIKALESDDPNEKTNMTGFADENYIKFQPTIPYTIYYENKDSATAPAHIVRIVDTLDKSKFDFSTFQFNSVTIADSTIHVLPGQKNLLLDFLVPDIDVLARFYGSFDSISGEVKWIIESLDPITLETIEDPEKGFLPPNINKPEGEGNVSFYIKLKSGLKNKAIINNGALIYFDANDPIVTNISSFALDLDDPESSVESLEYETLETEFPVSWSGQDDESGVRVYDVYVSENDEEFIRWRSRTSLTQDIFKGEKGNNYKFFSVAVDSVGHEEALSLDWDAETNVLVGTEELPKIISELIISPNPIRDKLVAQFYLEEDLLLNCYIVDPLGNKTLKKKNAKYSAGVNKISLDLNEFPKGIYLFILENGIERISRKIVLQ